MPPFRIRPALPVAAYKTYAIDSPSHPVTCEQAACAHWANGWQSAIDETTELGQAQAHYIRAESGRGFREHRDDAGLTVFTFPPGQRCFGQHHAPMEGAERFTERGGDWRGQTSPVVRHSPQGWADAFGEHQERLAEAIERG